jgi:hypothetical protein
MSSWSNEMDEEIISTRPVNRGEELLREKFVESIADQSTLMDNLAKQVITVELAVPGLYATVLKFTQGEGATAATDRWLYATFAFWFLALALAVASLIPRNWRVDPTMLKSDPKGKSRPLGLEDFFRKSAEHKRRLLIPSIVLFWLGILSAAAVVF